MSPATTLSRWPAEVLRDRFGITRLAKLTSLDNIGIPVWASVRPNSRTLAICQGKGVDDDAARASAVMEAMEVATAERFDLPFRSGSQSEFEACGYRVDVLPPLLRREAVAPPREMTRDWLVAHDLVRGGDVFVPAEAIRLDDTTQSIYWRSTDGLASGNILPEAVLHALCERIERDAMALWQVASNDAVEDRCVDPAVLQDSVLMRLVERVAATGMLLRLFDISTDIGVPVFFAIIFPADSASPPNHLDISSGSGCHPSPGRAAIRAVTEAAQSRLTKIAGVRDDFDPALYDQRVAPEILRYAFCRPRSRVNVAEAWQSRPEHFVDGVIACLKTAEITDILLVILADEPGFTVVKVIVLGLENPPGHRTAVGPRLVRRLTGLQ